MPYFEIFVAKVHTSRKLFTYESENELATGTIVHVTYGRQKACGIVMRNVKKPTFEVRAIDKQLTHAIPAVQMKLLAWMAGFYPEDYGDITQLFLPDKFLIKPPANHLPISVSSQIHTLPTPTAEQSIALEYIHTHEPRIMLHGDTGSGKTRVFMEAVLQTVAENKSALILTPEIGLTGQLVDEIKHYVPVPVIVTHSQMTPSQRRKAWLKASESTEPLVFVGPRSSVFLPFHNLGLIVIDESHDDSYKQLQAPRYRTLDVASKLAELSGAQLIQSTATPNIQDYYIAKQKGYVITRIHQKAAGPASGHIICIDTTIREDFRVSRHIADSVIDTVREATKKGQQALFFLNRRGSARSILCQACGWRPNCPACNIPYIYHHDQHLLRCHSCDRHIPPPPHCPECFSNDILYRGLGTKSLTSHLATLFPDARIQRFDTDSTKDEQLYRHIAALRKGSADIIVGTQTITKGLDLPMLSVVCAVQADDGLQFPDYRAEEITFQQLYQLVGRTIRGHTNGTAFLQTRQPHHPIFEALLAQKWELFATNELSKRRHFKYPPFCYLALCSITLKKAKNAQNISEQTARQLAENGYHILGPSPSFYEKNQRGYTWHIIIKSPSRGKLVGLREVLDQRWVIDIDPQNLL